MTLLSGKIGFSSRGCRGVPGVRIPVGEALLTLELERFGREGYPLYPRAEKGGVVVKWFRVTLLASVFLSLVVADCFAQEIPQGYIGSWKRDDGGTLVFEDRGGGVIVAWVTEADGSPGLSYALKYDGKDYPAARPGSTGRNTISSILLDGYSTEYALKRDGKVTGTGIRTVSTDGKTLTIKDPSGKERFSWTKQ